MGRLLTYKGIKCVFKCDPSAKLVIYMLTFPNGKKYIGQTVQTLRVRMGQHCSDATIKGRQWNALKCRAMRKYKYFEVSIIEHCRSADELNKREAEIILEYYERGAELYNVASGGLNNCEYFGKPCVVTDLEFNTLEEFDKIVEARDWMGVMGGKVSTLNRYIKISGRYYLFDKENYLRRSPAEHRMACTSLKYLRDESLSAKVVQIKYNHEVETVMPLCRAKIIFGDSIVSAIHGTSKRMYGYYWLLKTEYDYLVQNRVDIKTVIDGMDYILKIGLDGGIEGEYYTVDEAASANDISRGRINKSIYNNTVVSSEYFFILYSVYKNTKVDQEYITKRTVIERPTGEAKQVYEYQDNVLVRVYPSISKYARDNKIHLSTANEAIKRGKRKGTTLRLSSL